MGYNRLKKSMKKKISVIYTSLGMLVVSCFMSCTPDMMDAFSAGYRYGYENSELIKENEESSDQEKVEITEINLAENEDAAVEEENRI